MICEGHDLNNSFQFVGAGIDGSHCQTGHVGPMFGFNNGVVGILAKMYVVRD